MADNYLTIYPPTYSKFSEDLWITLRVCCATVPWEPPPHRHCTEINDKELSALPRAADGLGYLVAVASQGLRYIRAKDPLQVLARPHISDPGTKWQFPGSPVHKSRLGTLDRAPRTHWRNGRGFFWGWGGGLWGVEVLESAVLR